MAIASLISYLTLDANAGSGNNSQLDDEGRLMLNIQTTGGSEESLDELWGDVPDLPEFAVDPSNPPPPLNIVVFVVGSRVDLLPFIPICKQLRKDGHRVRIGTHAAFEALVKSHHLEFFDIGGDPSQLLSHMSKTPGVASSSFEVRKSDQNKKRKMIAEMMKGCWKACYAPDMVTGRPFAAQAIISNPPALAHIHIAEALCVPLHIIFGLPYTSTRAFPHPLSKVVQTNASALTANRLSYGLVDHLTFQGLGTIINEFRTKRLRLAELSPQSAALIVERLRIPNTYLWSPSLVAKPRDWKSHIEVTGFVFSDYPTEFIPSKELIQWLAQDQPPIYIGLGNVPIEDSVRTVGEIVQASLRVGVRIVLNCTGWASARALQGVPEHVFLVEDLHLPSEWLFSRCRAVVHNGMGGLVAAGLKLGKPTLIVPYFGDQPWWGTQIANSGAGPKSVPPRKLKEEVLVEAFNFLMRPSVIERAKELSNMIVQEQGVREAVGSFYRHLPTLNMRCDLDPSRAAIWWERKWRLKLSGFAAQVLVEADKLKYSDLDFHSIRQYDTQAMQPFLNSVISRTRTNAANGSQVFGGPPASIASLVSTPMTGSSSSLGSAGGTQRITTPASRRSIKDAAAKNSRFGDGAREWEHLKEGSDSVWPLSKAFGGAAPDRNVRRGLLEREQAYIWEGVWGLNGANSPELEDPFKLAQRNREREASHSFASLGAKSSTTSLPATGAPGDSGEKDIDTATIDSHWSATTVHMSREKVLAAWAALEEKRGIHHSTNKLSPDMHGLTRVASNVSSNSKTSSGNQNPAVSRNAVVGMVERVSSRLSAAPLGDSSGGGWKSGFNRLGRFARMGREEVVIPQRPQAAVAPPLRNSNPLPDSEPESDEDDDADELEDWMSTMTGVGPPRKAIPGQKAPAGVPGRDEISQWMMSMTGGGGFGHGHGKLMNSHSTTFSSTGASLPFGRSPRAAAARKSPASVAVAPLPATPPVNGGASPNIAPSATDSQESSASAAPGGRKLVFSHKPAVKRPGTADLAASQSSTTTEGKEDGPLYTMNNSSRLYPTNKTSSSTMVDALAAIQKIDEKVEE